MLPPNSNGAPQQDAATVHVPTCYYTDQLDLGVDLIVESLKKRAMREVTEGGSSLADADELLRKLTTHVSRRIFEKVGVLGVSHGS